MRLIPLAAAVLSLCGPVAAQTPPPATAPAPSPAPSPAPAPPLGVSVADTVAWLRGVGATVGEPAQAGGRTYISVNDGRLAWTLWFYSCGEILCDDIQFSAVVSGGAVGPDAVNAWNRDNRFLKAFYAPAEGQTAARAVVQYDVLLSTQGTAQLVDPTAVWLSLLDKFAVAMGATAPAAPASTGG